jgi:hypothetical protein
MTEDERQKSLFLEQTAIAPMARLNIQLRKTCQFQFMGNGNLPADFLDDKLTDKEISAEYKHIERE